MYYYQMSVPHIHCSGCVNLIKLNLEDDFVNIEIDENTKIVKFASELERDEVEEKLDVIFESLRESDYDYVDFKSIEED